MKTSNIILIIVIVLVSLAVAWRLQQKAALKRTASANELRRYDEQLIRLTAEHQKLSNQVHRFKGSTNDLLSELDKLRNQTEALQKQTSALSGQFKSNRPPQQPPSAPRSPEYYNQLHRLAGAKGRDATSLSQAFLIYASDHGGSLPSSLDQVAPYLRKQRIEVSGTNHFEIVFHGSMEDIKRIPGGAVALIRDPQTWTAPSGKKARVYGLANGTGQIVESDDDFKAWEAEHIVPPALPK